MKRAVALLTQLHRYLGLLFCLIFVVWFASGLVMIYAGMPEYAEQERLERLVPLDPASIRLTPADALDRALLGEPPARVRISSVGARPVYRFLVQGEWVTVFADDGSVLEPLNADAALDVVRRAFPEQRASARVARTLDEPDQWTIETSFRTSGALHLVSLGDAAATDVYVAENTGEIVMKTDRASRLWGYAGPVMHWFYFRPLRVQGELWFTLIVYGSAIGCVISVLGLAIGLYRFSLARLRRGAAATPYVGWLRWHHYAGLIFGVITLTWTFSGMLSMEPWGISGDAAPTREQVVAVRGGGVDAARYLVSPPQALAMMSGARELDLVQFMGQPFYRAQRGDGRPLLVTADRGPAVKDGFTRDELLAAAAAAMPGVRAESTAWLTAYDGYYYDRRGERPLPVLRVKYADRDRSWLYLTARDGGVALRETQRGRVVRWLYHGLHSLDFPGLYRAGLLWDAVIVTLCAGGLLLSLTSVAVGWRRLKIFSGSLQGRARAQSDYT